MTIQRKIIAILAILAVGLVGFVTLGGTYDGAVAMRDCASIDGAARESQARGDEATATVRYQEAAACRGVDLDASTQSPEETLDSAVDAKPTATPKAETKTNPAPATDVKSSTYKPYTGEQLAIRPAIEKVSVNSYGPKMAVHPNFSGKDLAALTDQEARDELKFRLSLSPVLAAGTGAAMGMWSYDRATVDAKSMLFASNPAAHKAAVTQINATTDSPHATVIDMPAGTYAATYAITGDKGSYVRIDNIVNRPTGFKALVFSNGTMLRLECGFQQYWTKEKKSPAAPAPKSAPKPATQPAPQPAPAAPKSAPKPATQPAPQPAPKSTPVAKMPKPSPGIVRTPEGTPKKTPPPTGKHTPTPTPDEPKHTPTPTPTPDKPKHTPTPIPTPDKPKHTPTPTPTPDKPKHTPTPTPTPDKPKHTPTPTPTPDKPKHTPTPDKIPSKDPVHNNKALVGGGKNDDPGPGPVTKPRPKPTADRVNPAPRPESNKPKPGSGSGSTGGQGSSKTPPKVNRPKQPAPQEPAAPKKDKPAEAGPLAPPE